MDAVSSWFKVSRDRLTEYDQAFKGNQGSKFKNLVKWAASQVGINPGLLSANALAEAPRSTYLSTGKVNSFHGPGTDDFYEERDRIRKRVPAFTKIRWDKNNVVTHYNDAKHPRTPRLIKTVWYNDGKNALLANAVYMKYHEEVLRDKARRVGKDFDALSNSTRFALTRYAVNAGLGAASTRLLKALKGKDIIIRREGKFPGPRAASVRAAQALHLSNTIFKIPIQPRRSTPTPRRAVPPPSRMRRPGR